MNTASTVNEYISAFPPKTQKLLKQLRTTIRKAAHHAEEVLRWGMPAYKLNGMLVYFAGYQNHIGLYPMPAAITRFKEQLVEYKTRKSTVQFPLDKQLPLELITNIVNFRVKENLEKEAVRQSAKQLPAKLDKINMKKKTINPKIQKP